jgi:multiple sugar transport system permease protein
MRKMKRTLSNSVRYAILIAWTCFVLIPLIWMLSTSLKLSDEWVTWPPRWIPERPSLTNYRALLGMERYELLYMDKYGGKKIITNPGGTTQFFTAVSAFKNSSIVATTSAVLALLCGSALAYSISRFKVGGNNFRYMLLGLRMLPPIVLAVPFLVYYATLKLTDSYVGLIMVYFPVSIPYVVWMMVSFIDQVPVDIENAARVMGASRFLIFRKIILPLVGSGLVVTFLFTFILCWSEFLFALTLTQSKAMTLPVALSAYQSAAEGKLFGPQAAFGAITTIPVMLIGIFIQKHLLRGFSFGMVRK